MSKFTSNSMGATIALKTICLAAAIGLAGAVNAQEMPHMSTPDMAQDIQAAMHKSLNKDMRSFEKAVIRPNGVLVSKPLKADRQKPRSVVTRGYAVQPFKIDLQAPNILPGAQLNFPELNIHIAS